MFKFHRMLSTVLVTAIMFSGLPSGSTQITRAQANPSKSWENIFNNLFEKKEDNQPSVPSGGGTSRAMNRNEDNPPPVPSGGGTSRSINRNEDNRPPTPGRVGGSRGDKLCAIAPQPITTSTVVWSDRPLFVWRGVISRMEVRSTGSTKVLWSKKEIEGQSKEGQSSALYAGEALQPGQTYDWLLFQSAAADASPIQRVIFRVMDAKERDQIKMQLQNLEKELQAKGASAEEIAMQRAQFFVQQNLWSDVLQAAYSVKNPSPALTEMIEALPNKLCS